MIAAGKYSKDIDCVYYCHQSANQYHWFVPQSSHWLLPNISWKYIPFIYIGKYYPENIYVTLLTNPFTTLTFSINWNGLDLQFSGWLAHYMKTIFVGGREGRALGMLWSTCIFIGPIPDYCTLLVFHATQYILIPNQLGEMTNIKNKRDNNYK